MTNIPRILFGLCVALVLSACASDDEPAPAPEDTVAVLPMVETEPVISADDAADDPAIWINPDNPEKSLVVGTDKKNGLVVYDLAGAIVYQNADGRMNNVDLRAGVPVTTGKLGSDAPTDQTIVAATNRTTKTIAVYAMDPTSGVLRDILNEPIPAELDDPYGLCLYESAKTGNLYIFANGKDGVVRQWHVFDAGQGTMSSTMERMWSVGSQTEGCVADDDNGWLFIGEEGVGIWRYGAEPDDPSETRVAIDSTGLGEPGGGRLSADVEGLALYIPPDTGLSAGYLVASSQGNFTYVIYDRAPPHAYRGTFQLVDNPRTGVDGVGETDGLDVTALPAGRAYPDGLLVVQDGFNTSATGANENQNFKYVSWRDVAEALDLN